MLGCPETDVHSPNKVPLQVGLSRSFGALPRAGPWVSPVYSLLPTLRTTVLWHIQGDSAGPKYLPTSVLDSEAGFYPVSLQHLGVP